MDPRDLPEIKQDMLDFHLLSGSAFFGGSMYESMTKLGVFMDEMGHEEVSTAAWRFQGEFLERAEVLYMTGDMTAKILEGAETLPDFMPIASDAPFPSGIAYFEGLEKTPWGNGKKRVSAAISWNVTEGHGTTRFLIGHYVDLKSGEEFPYKASMRDGIRRMGFAPPRLMIHSLVPSQTRDDRRGEFLEKFKNVEDNTIAILKTAWIMMRQEEVSESSETEPSRNSSKRIRRQGGEPGKVRIVDIRSHTGGSQGREQYAREYDHRWKVRGHWRNQWYPSRGVHRPKWIEEHVRGPEDMPLIEKPTVYRLK
ncbi:hypothetical protein SEA_YARA_103 [Streptomyces phage Yara]|nr:hypothetical protein SEA_YARA_103 [Streptomyces phage Yara]